jgi:hypothetical protein
MPAALAIWDCVLPNASRISLSTMSASSSGSNSAAGLGQSATSPAPGSPGLVAFYTISQFTLNNFASGATVGAVTPIRNFPKYFSFGVSAVYDANSDPHYGWMQPAGLAESPPCDSHTRAHAASTPRILCLGVVSKGVDSHCPRL